MLFFITLLFREGYMLEISVVIPAYDEEQRLGGTLKAIMEFLRGRGTDYEIIVVDDGSQDGTADAVKAMAISNPCVRLYCQNRNRGKGYATKVGVFKARGERILVTDADLSTPIQELEKLLPFLDQGYDITIGSRGLRESNLIVRQPWYRERMGKAFNLLVRLIVGLELHDTQCGFKCFTKKAAEVVFSRQTLDGFGFDVEILHIARRNGLSVKEVPVALALSGILAGCLRNYCRSN